MNELFKKHADRLPSLFARLDVAPEKRLSDRGHPASPGIYVLIEEGKPVHVGRTRNLRQRLQGHRSNSHYSASFAFKRARRELEIIASYKPEGSRAQLAKDSFFGPVFRKHIEQVRAMSYKFVELESKLDQYLLELYAVLEYDLPDDEFDTH